MRMWINWINDRGDLEYDVADDLKSIAYLWVDVMKLNICAK